MRAALRLLANVKPRYLEAFAPTGLTGLETAPFPRLTLLTTYDQTLEKLKSFPESSAYRQSVEATTRHRKNIVESRIPPGYEAWKERVRKLIAEDPERYAIFQDPSRPGSFIFNWRRDGTDDPHGEAYDEFEYYNQFRKPKKLEEPMTPEERVRAKNWQWEEENQDIKWENEPALTADQISEIEKEIGHGLIEEIIEVAKAELELTYQLYEDKVWEELEEKPAPGQWSYFERH